MSEVQSPAGGAYADWVGRRETTVDRIALAPARGLLATLNDAATVLTEGDELPPLWHWLYFLAQAPQSAIDVDGHPVRGGFLPPVDLPRRMFAGARMTFEAPLRIGVEVRRESEILDVVEKSGRSGRLVFVTVRNRIYDGDRLCIEETRNIVYREAGGPTPAPVPLSELPAAPAGAWVETVSPDPVLLFRYSALTFNGHRIHYDYPYVTGEEGYPGLVVHGPLIATLLIDLVRRHADRPVRAFQFRANAPLFAGAPFRVIGQTTGEGIELTAERCDGAAAMTATAELLAG